MSDEDLVDVAVSNLESMPRFKLTKAVMRKRVVLELSSLRLRPRSKLRKLK